MKLNFQIQLILD